MNPPHSGIRVDNLRSPLQTIAHCRPDACTIPHLCLAHVDSDVRVPPRRHLKKVVNPARPVKWGHNERVIEEREKVFARQQMTGNILQSAVLPEGIQQWHHCVSLLATLSLGDGVDLAEIGLPQILRTLPIEQSGKRHHVRVYYNPSNMRREIKSNAPTPSTDVMVACGTLEGVCHALATNSGGHRELVWTGHKDYDRSMRTRAASRGKHDSTDFFGY